MQDEHFLRDWNEGHAHFSAGLDRLLNKALGGGRNGLHGIDRPYDSEAYVAHDPMRGAANSLVSGLAAVIATLALFVTIVTLAMPASADAAERHEALASVLDEGLLL